MKLPKMHVLECFICGLSAVLLTANAILFFAKVHESDVQAKQPVICKEIVK